MTIESELFTRLSTASGVTALVGSGSAARVYPNVAPQDVSMPYVTFRRVSTVRESGMGEDAGLVQSRVQVDAFAASHLAALGLADAIVGATQRWRAPSGSPAILDTFIENQLMTFEPDPLVHHAVVDLRMWHRE